MDSGVDHLILSLLLDTQDPGVVIHFQKHMAGSFQIHREGKEALWKGWWLPPPRVFTVAPRIAAQPVSLREANQSHPVSSYLYLLPHPTPNHQNSRPIELQNSPGL